MAQPTVQIPPGIEDRTALRFAGTPAELALGGASCQVAIPLPNLSERAAILAVHAAAKHLAPDVDLHVTARATPGFSGADLANLVNEAAINAVRAGRTVIEAHDLDAARDRVLLGRRETSNALLPEERHAVAVHESGHALLAALRPPTPAPGISPRSMYTPPPRLRVCGCWPRVP